MLPRQSRARELDIGPGGHGSASDRHAWRKLPPPNRRGAWSSRFALLSSGNWGAPLVLCPADCAMHMCVQRGGPVSPCVGGEGT